MKRPALVAAAAVALVILAAAGYWMRGVAKQHADQGRIISLLGDTTGQLRQALAPQAEASLVQGIDANLKAVPSGSSELAEAAELYIVNAREIARRRVESERLEQDAAASRTALAAHMARGGRRNAAWFNGAMELKKRVEREHSDLDVTLKALDQLLYELPESEKQLAPHVPPTALLDAASREAARREAQLEAKRATAALQRARDLALR